MEFVWLVVDSIRGGHGHRYFGFMPDIIGRRRATKIAGVTLDGMAEFARVDRKPILNSD
jgi:hypothetical protein